MYDSVREFEESAGATSSRIRARRATAVVESEDSVRHSPVSVYGLLTGVATQRILVLLGAVALLVQSLMLLETSPATGYETSLVAAYPPEYWAALGVVVAGVVLVFLGSAVTRTGYWKHAFVLLASTYGLFMFLPIARGYKLYGRGTSDPLFHLNVVKRIVASGSIGDLFYPMLHLTVVELTFVGMPLEATQPLLGFIFTMLFVGGIALFVRTLVDDNRALALGLCAATPLLLADFHGQLHPALNSFTLLPAALVALEYSRRENSVPFLVVAVILLVTIVFYHPVTALLTILVVLSMGGVTLLYPRLSGQSLRPLRLIIVPGLFALFTGWYLLFEQIQRAILSVFSSSQEAPIESQAALTAGLSTTDILLRFVELHGRVFVYFLIAGLFGLLIIRELLADRSTYPETLGVTQYALGGFVAVAFLTVNLIAANPTRFSRYLILFAVVLVALLLYRLVVVGASRRQVLVVTVVVAIIAAGLLGPFTVYIPNKHLTHSEYEGTEFAISHNGGQPFVSSGESFKTIVYTVAGTGVKFQLTPLLQDPDDFFLPRHLGYDESASAAETFDHPYVVTMVYDREQHTAAYFTPEQRENRFLYDDEDLARLHADPTANKVYENGGFELWHLPHTTA